MAQTNVPPGSPLAVQRWETRNLRPRGAESARMAAHRVVKDARKPAAKPPKKK